MKLELIFIGIAVLITLVTFINFDWGVAIGCGLITFLTINGLMEKR